MRRPSVLAALFTAPRQGLLVSTLLEPERWWYLSDLARHLGVHHATLQRELGRLSAAGILVTRRDGNRVYYRANADSPIFPELRALLAKTAGLVDLLRESLQPFATRIGSAFVFGSIARASETPESDVDLMIIGEVALRELAPALRKAEKALRRPINPSLYRPAEFVEKVAAGSGFVREVLNEKKLFVVGDQNGLDGLVAGGARRGTQPRPRRDRRTTPRR